MKENEKTYYVIEGKDRTGIEIVQEYAELILEDGFDMTVTEASHILGCSYQYFARRIMLEINHIRVNSLAKTLYFKFYQDDLSLPLNGKEKLHNLMKMRVLLNRKDFTRYIRESTVIERKYFPIFESDFDSYLFNKIKESIIAYNAEIKKNSASQVRLSNLIYNITPNEDSKPKCFYFPLGESERILDKYYSMKELRTVFSENHDSNIYLQIKQLGINKIKMCEGALVRYDIRDFSRNPLAVISYESYNNIKKKLPSDVSFIEYLTEELESVVKEMTAN